MKEMHSAVDVSFFFTNYPHLQADHLVYVETSTHRNVFPAKCHGNLGTGSCRDRAVLAPPWRSNLRANDEHRRLGKRALAVPDSNLILPAEAVAGRLLLSNSLSTAF